MKTVVGLDKFASRLRTRRIRSLRCVYVLVDNLFQDHNRIKQIHDLIDQELKLLGADPEGERRTRHHTYLTETNTPDYKVMQDRDREIARMRYEEWLRSGGHLRYPL